VTWWEPDAPWAGPSPQYVARVRAIIDSLHIRTPEDRDGLLDRASTTVLCDTICGPGWSKALCCKVVREWLESGFTHALLYRHTRLLPRWAGSREAAHDGSLGNNRCSERALRVQGYWDIGMRLSDTFAVRCGGQLWVRPEEGWMVAELQDALRRLEEACRPGTSVA
jgi:hypothetical protein